MNWHLTGEEAGYIVDDCEATVLVADARVGAIATEVAARAPGATMRLAVGGADRRVRRLRRLRSPRRTPAALDDPVYGSQMLYTSGTTGRPKGVTPRPGLRGHQPRRPRWRASSTTAPAKTSTCAPARCTTRRRWRSALTVPFLNGATIVLMDGWDAEETLRLVDEHARHPHAHGADDVRAPPEARCPRRARAVRRVVAAQRPARRGAVPAAVKQALIEWLGPVVYEYYAATEGTGTWVDPHTWLTKPGTVGQRGAAPTTS